MTALVQLRNDQRFNDGTIEELLTRFNIVTRAGIYMLYDTRFRDGLLPFCTLDFNTSKNKAQIYLDTCNKDPLVVIAMLGLVSCASLSQKGETFPLMIQDERGPFKVVIKDGTIQTQQLCVAETHKNGLRLPILASAISVAEQLGITPPDNNRIRELWRHGFAVPATDGERRVIVRWRDDKETVLLAEIHANGYVAYPRTVDYSYNQFLLVCAAIWAMSTVEREYRFVLPDPRPFAPQLRAISVSGGELTLVHVQNTRATEPAR